MCMKKKKLIIADPLEDTTLLGITSPLKAYQLAWLINKTTALQLSKVADLYFEVPGHATSYTTRFLFATEHCTYRLIKNRGIVGNEKVANYLVSSLRHIDFFFSVQDFTQTFDSSVFCSALGASNKITYMENLDPKVYKAKAPLFFHG